MDPFPILTQIEAFRDVPAAQLEWLIARSRQHDLRAGDYLFREGEPVVNTQIILSGLIRFIFPLRGLSQEFTLLEPGEITGYLPYSRIKNAQASGLVLQDASVLSFSRDHLQELVTHHFELTQALVAVMTTRVRDWTSQQKQDEKMMALGKLSAGLAHELNNPISSIVRNAENLQRHLHLQPEGFKAVISIKMPSDEVDIVNALLFDKLAQRPAALTLMQRAALEDQLADWFDDHGVEHASEIAENLVAYGFTTDDLRVFKAKIPSAHLNPIFNWINQNLVTERIVGEIREASSRVSTLIQSVKVYTHMDRTQDLMPADLHEGIRNTLTMLGYRLRRVRVEEDYDPAMPPVTMQVGAMNQVWTNLIDNALDALEHVPDPVLRIHTERDGEFVKVQVIDNGPGIPADLKDRIFEPFFTTKELGKGTGLGLDTVLGVVQQHRGRLKVASQPGRTEFEVCFPIQP
ncbi:His Kinase A (phospho-acceptor) domain-containing protein [Catalinimonas alkaloidigena]|uniref:histidine kinase n=1 Tax=Catalinimonas alkaloidigena TaxID=1075417 RepID=A0A1G8X5I4_9BACT|nr:ATP-binding protein [Catalinimonas alkaloidigena]SDJ85803.1 His Kinase A (phospho-acceptor) domain-containing protein [Catalinimonas alkaloidigena]